MAIPAMIWTTLSMPASLDSPCHGLQRHCPWSLQGLQSRSGTSAKSNDHAHPMRCTADDWCPGASNHVPTNGQHQEVRVEVLVENLGRS